MIEKNDGNILLGGKIIAILNANDWSFTILYKENYYSCFTCFIKTYYKY